MSWKKFGGTDKLDKMNMMNVNYISTDALSTSSPYVGDFDINGELTVYKKSFLKNDTDISGELIVSQNVKIAKNIDISGDITIDGQIKSTQSIAMTDGVFAGNISVIDNTHLGNSIYYDATFINNINQNPHGFLKGTQQSIGINTFTPQYTVDISGGSQLFRAYTNNSNSKSVLLETKSNQPQSKNTIQLFSDLSMVGMQFDYNGDTVGNIFMDENTFTIHTASYMDISSDHITIGKNEGYTGNSSERMTVYDNAVSQYLNNSESILGQSISCIAQDNSSVTFVSLLTPAQVGAHIGGGAYPFDKSKAYGAITLNENEIPALSLLQSDHSVQNRTSIGINTYTPKTNKYILDVNGPVHIENGQIEKVLTTQFEIKTVPKSNVITPNISVYGAPSTISSGSYIKKAYSSTTNGEKWSIANIITGEETFTTSSNAILSSYTYINGNQRTDLIAGEGGYIFKKELNDATWTFIGISQAIVYKAVWMDAFHYYGCTNSTLYRYVNSTYTRSFISISTYITNVNAIYGFRNSNNTIIVIVGNTGIYSTSNFSSTLTTINNTNIYYDVHSLLISNVNHVIAVGDNIISVSINNGSTWTHQSSPHQWKSVYISPTFAIIGGDNGALKYSAYPYTTWNDIPESILNSSGNKNILSNINIKHLTMTDANTLLLNYTSTVYDLFTNTLGSSSIYYLYLPQLFNPYDNFVFDISGSTHLDGDVFIKRNIHTKNIATFEGNVESTSYTSGTVTVVGGVGIVGNTNISRNVDIGKTAIIRNTDLSENALMVFGNTVITNNTKIYGNADISQNLRVSSVVDACLNSYPYGALIVNGGVGIQKNAFIGNSVNIENSARIGNALTVGNTITTSQLIINGDDAINYSTGAIQLVGGMGILGNLYVKDLTVTGNTINDNETNMSSLVITSNLNATDISSGAMIVYGGVGIQKDIYMGGNAYLLQSMSVFEHLDISKNLTVEGNSHFMGTVTIDTSINLLQNQTVEGNVIVQGDSIVNNLLDVSFSRIRGKLDVSGDITVDGNLIMNSNAIINQNIQCYGNIDVSNVVTITNTNNAIKNGDGGSLHTYGGAMVEKNMIIYGNVDISNTLIANSIVLNGQRATNYRTGAIQLVGGMGISGELYSSSIVSERIDVSNMNVLKSLTISSTTQSINRYTGALTISGGVGIEGNTNIGGNVIISGNTRLIRTTDICGNMTSQYTNVGRLRVREELDISGTTNIDADLFVNFDQFIRGGLEINGNTTMNAYMDASFGRVRGLLQTYVTDSSFISSALAVDVSGRLNVDGFTDLSSGRVRSRFEVVNLDMSNGRVTSALDISGRMRVDGFTDLLSGRVRNRFEVVNLDLSNGRVTTALDISGRMTVDGFTDLLSGRVRNRFEVVNLDMSNGRVTTALDISGRMTVDGMTDLSSGRVRSRFEVVNLDMSNGRVTTALDISGRMTVDGFTDLSGGRVRNRFEVSNLDVSNGNVTTTLNILGNLRVDGFTDLSYGRVKNALDVSSMDVGYHNVWGQLDVIGNCRIRSAFMTNVDISFVKVSLLDVSGRLTINGFTDLSSGRVRGRFEAVNLDMSNGRVTTALDLSGRLNVDGFTDLSSGRVRSRFEVVNLDMSNGRVTTALDISGRMTVDGFTDLSSGRVRSRFEAVNLDMSNGRVTTALDISGRMTVDGFTDLLSGRVRNRFEVVNLDMSNGRVTTALDISGRMTVDGFTDLLSGRVRNRFEVVNLDLSNGRVTTALDISGRMTVDGFTDLSSGRVRNRFEVVNLDLSNGRVTNTFDVSGNVRADGFTDLLYGRVRGAFDISGDLTVDGRTIVAGIYARNQLDVSGNVRIDGSSDLSYVRVRNRFDVSGNVRIDSLSNIYGIYVPTNADISGNVRIDGITDLASSRVRSRFDVSGDVRMDGFTDLAAGRVRNRFDVSGNVRMDGFTDISGLRVRNRFDVSGNVRMDDFTDLSYARVRGNLEVNGMDIFSNITTLNTRTTNFSRSGGILTINSNVTIPADKNFIFGGLDGNIRFNNIENKLVNITNTNTNNTYDLTIGNFTNNNTIRLNSTASITLQVPTVNIIGNADLNSGNIGNVNTISLKAGGDIQINNVSMNTRLESVEMKTYDFNYDTTSGNVLTIGNTYNYDVIQLNANTDVILAPVNGHIKLNGNIDAMGNNIGNVNVINVNAGGDIQIGGTSITSGGALLTSSNTWSGDINRFKVLTASGYLSVSGDIVATGNTQVSRRLAVSGDSSLNGFTDLSGGRVKNNFVVGSYNISNEFSRLSRIKWGLDNCWNITKNANESLGSVMNFGWDGTTGDQFDNYYVNYHAIRSVEEIGLRSKQINLIGNTTLNGNTTTLPRNRFLYALGDCSFSGNIDASYAKVTNDINVFGYSAKYEFGKLVWTVFSNWSTYWESNETSTVMNLGWNGNQNTSTASNYVNYLSLKSNYTIGLKSPMILVNGESIFTGNLKVNAPTDISLNSVNGNIYLRSTSLNGSVILHGTNIKFWGPVTTDDNNLHIGNGNIVNVKNITSSGTISSTGTGGNVYSGGVIRADGTITGGNISTSGTITATGNISGGNISTGGTLTVTGAISGGSISTGGTITATGNITSSATIQAVTFKATSDYRIKSNCEPLSLTHYNVDLLKPITYYNTILKKQDIGFIAHEVQELYPFLVDGEKDGEKHQSLNYIGMIGILVKEIQELKAKVKRLEENMNIV